MLSFDKLNLKAEVRIAVDVENDHKLDCLAELVNHVHELTKEFQAPYTLFVSGGVDSQLMLYAWKLSGVPFKAVRVNYMGLNDHDFKEGALFCEQQNIHLTTLSFDLLHFLENDLDHYAMTYKCASPHICTHMAFSRLVPEGTKVFAGNLIQHNHIAINNTIYGLQRFATMSGDSIIPFFLTENTRVARASIMARVEYTSEQNEYERKCALYSSFGVPIIPQATKLTGFEVVKEYYDQFDERVTDRMKLEHSKYISKRVFDHLFRNKYLAILDNHYHTVLVQEPL